MPTDVSPALTVKQRNALHLMQRYYNQGRLECAVSYSEPTFVSGGQPFIHWKTLVSLVDKGLAIYECDVDGSVCGATEYGMRVAI